MANHSFIEDGKETVNHPSHYNQGNFEVIDVIEDWKLGFHDGNAVKYIARARHKENELKDLKKAAWYLERYIKIKEFEKIKGFDTEGEIETPQTFKAKFHSPKEGEKK